MFMKSFWTKWMVLALGLSLLVSCGGGGGSSGGGDTMTLTINGVSKTYRENLPYSIDPIISGYDLSFSGQPVLRVDMTSEFSYATYDYNKWLLIGVEGVTPGDYIIPDAVSFTDINFDNGGISYSARPGGVITITRLDTIGGRIQGTFSATMYDISLTFPDITLSGSFDVTREN